MNFPSLNEYIEALKDAEGCLKEFNHLQLVTDQNGNPATMSSGNFAAMFKMYDPASSKYYALKCFTRWQQQREESYQLITNHLQYVDSPYLAKMQFVEDELFGDIEDSNTSTFPALLMDWVEGVPLDKYVARHLRDKHRMEVLTYRFSQMATWLLAQPFAHGDLKPDNILVREDGSLVMVDYDGMFVPEMNGEQAREQGSPHYRHPLRTEHPFDERIDDFPLTVILLSLRALTLMPELHKRFGSSDHLLLSDNDFCQPGQSDCLQRLATMLADTTLTQYYALMLTSLTQGSLSKPALQLLQHPVPKAKVAPVAISTTVTDEDRANSREDKYGAIYSADGKKLISGPRDIISYNIVQGTEIICDQAFFLCTNLGSIIIPDSVTSIGDGAFFWCENLQNIIIPDSVTSIGDGAFSLCTNLGSITIPNSVTSIEDRAFDGCENLQNIIIPDSVTSIGDRAFCECNSLQSITIPDSVTSIGNRVFHGCSSLQSVIIPDSVTTIGAGAFWGCSSLQSITIPDSVTNIGAGAFWGCSSLQSITIPNSVTSIGGSTFYGCKNLQSITIPNSVTSIGGSTFYGCKNLQSITIPNSVTSIGNKAFCECNSLQSITIPNSVTSIGNGAFRECGLQNIIIPNSVKSIGDGAFYGTRIDDSDYGLPF